MTTDPLHLFCNFDPYSPISVSDFEQRYLTVPQNERHICLFNNLKVSTLYNNAYLIQHIVVNRKRQDLLNDNAAALVHVAIEQGSFTSLLALYKLGLHLDSKARYAFQVRKDLTVHEFAVATMAYDMRAETQDIARLVSLIENNKPTVTLTVDDYASSKARFESQIASAKAKNVAKKALLNETTFAFPPGLQTLMLDYAIDEDEELCALAQFKSSTSVPV